MVLEHVALFCAALAMCAVSGANDGATLAATSSRSGAFSPLAGIGALSLAAGAAPLLVGTKVAATLAHGLVSFESGGGRLAFLSAVAIALCVVAALARRGLPTSLTMALSGAIVGVGLGDDLPTRWSTALGVLGAGIGAPFLALLVAFALAPVLRRALGDREHAAVRGRRLGVIAFLAQSLAYGANDAEKLVAILAVATGAGTVQVHATLAGQGLIALCFGLGALTSIRAIAPRLTTGMARPSQDGTLSALIGATAAVLGGAVIGMPLSSTQAVTAALLGGSARLTPWGVRWQPVRQIFVAWVATLPLALGLGALLGAAVRLA
ncbi:MAG: inorganic phosphate transporter [Actinomycetota bacterium]|nr:inorganic phosphate transporter [Actinomycetota bacterium]